MCPLVTPDFVEQKLEPGTYLAKIVSCEHKKSKTGTPYLNWKFETIGSMPDHQWVYAGTGLTGKGAQILKALIQAAFDPKYESGPIDTDILINCEVMITVEKNFNPDGSESPYLRISKFEKPSDSFEA